MDGKDDNCKRGKCGGNSYSQSFQGESDVTRPIASDEDTGKCEHAARKPKLLVQQFYGLINWL